MINFPRKFQKTAAKNSNWQDNGPFLYDPF